MKLSIRNFLCMVLVLTATLFSPYGVSSSFAHLFNFQWTANHANDEVDFYRIYWSYVSREYDDPSAPDARMTAVPGGGFVYPEIVDNIEYDISEVSSDDIVCFTVTAVDTNGYESDYSNQLCYGPMIDDFIITENNYTSFDLSGWAEAGAGVTIYLEGSATPLGSATADQYSAWTVTGLDFTGIPEGEVTLFAVSNGKTSPIAVGILDTATSSFTAGPGATDVTNISATIMWSTNEATKTVLEYRTADQSLPEEEQQQGSLPNNDFLIDHSMVINGLTPATSYYYRVRATDAAGNVLLSSEKAFKTSFEPDTTDPQVTPPVHNVESATSANISWNVNELCNTVLRYGTVSGALSASVLDFGTGNRAVILTNLIGNTIYYYQVEATDTSGNGPTITAEQSFATLNDADTTPPVIDEATIDVEVEDRRATITWVTDEFSDSVVEYGTTPTYGQSVTVDTDVMDHSVTLVALNPLTTYYFRVSSTDDTEPPNGPAVSTGKSFTTPATPDTTDPEFDSPPTVNVTDTTATITWRTNEECSSSVQYDTVSHNWDAYANNKDDIILKTEHSVTLTGLTPNTAYFYQVGITDGANNGPTLSPQSGFPTESPPDTTDPQFVVPPTVTGKTDTTAVIAWSTDEESTSLVRYGTSSSNWDGYPFSLNSATLAQGHEITLTNLTADTDYFVMVGSTDALGNGPALSQEVGFSTDAEVDDERPRVTVPPTVTGITNTSVIIQWQTDEPANGEVRFDTVESEWDAYDHVVIDGHVDTNHTVVLNNLFPKTPYFFRVGSTDSAGNGPSTDPDETNNPFSEELFTTLTDPDVEAPQIINGLPEVAAMDIDSAIITWETDEPSNSLVQYGLSGVTWSDLTSSASDGTMTTKHSVTLTDLAPSTRYHFAVGSQDAAGNGPLVNSNATNPSIVSSFTTEAEADTVAPVISNVFMSFATDTTALITWITDEPANSLVQYGTISSEWGSYPYAESDADMQNEHSVTITNLQPGTHYVFRIASTDANGNGPTYNPSPPTNPYIEGSFTTNVFPDTEAPQIAGDVNIFVNLAEMSAVVRWTTPDEPGNSQVQYDDEPGQAWGEYAFSENDAEMVREHTVVLTNLEFDTIYFVRVSSVDASGNNHAASDTDQNPSLEYNFILKSPPPSSDAPDLPGSPNTPAEQASGEDVATCFIQSSGAGRLLNFEF